MGLFNKAKPETKITHAQNSELAPVLYPRKKFIRVLVFNSWQGNLVLALQKIENEYSLTWRVAESENWSKASVTSREAGESMLSEFRRNPQSLIEKNFISGVTSYYAWGIKTFGFENVDFENLPDGYTGDYLFSLGRDLEEKIEAGWLPTTHSERKLMLNFFALSPLRVGYFGPFKYILKNLSDRLDNLHAKYSAETVQSVVGTLGIGYGRIEGYMSRGIFSPGVPDESWTLDEIASIASEAGRPYPKKKTAQFLMRKGMRLLNDSVELQKKVSRTRFIVGVLRAADFSHESRMREEEEYLENQQLVSSILYGESGLATRDRESRKMILGPRKERHSLGIAKTWLETLTPEELDMYKVWLEGFEGRHRSLALYALNLCEVRDELVFPWNTTTIGTLLSSESKIARDAITKALLENPSLFRSMPQAANLELLSAGESKLAQLLLADIEAGGPYAGYGPLASQWVLRHFNDEFTPFQFQIAEVLLRSNWQSIPNSLYDWGGSNGIPIRDLLFIKLAKKTKLAPVESWIGKALLGYYDMPQQFAFYGVQEHPKYPEGLLDVMDVRDPAFLLYLANQIATSLRHTDITKTNEILGIFFGSKKRGAVELVWAIIQNKLIADNKIIAFLEEMNKIDPSGNAFLKGMSSAISKSDRTAVFRYLSSLSDESKDTFWRRNGEEVKALLMAWREFPDFIWKNLDIIPERVLSRLKKYDGLDIKILKVITPASISKLTPIQVDYFVELINKNPTIGSNSSLLRAMLLAPSAQINLWAAKYVKTADKYSLYWLIMLESNLPVSQSAAEKYLDSLMGHREFVSRILMALDSNNAGARRIAIKVLGKVKSEAELSKIVQALLENPNADIWKVVSNNLDIIDDAEKYKEFTKNVFMSKRKARAVKEEIKSDLQEFIEDISEVIEEKTLVRMVLGNNQRDREWALRQIAVSGLSSEDVKVESAWGRDTNV